MPQHLYAWFGFSVFVLILLVFDLGFFHAKEREVSPKQAVAFTIIWIGLALGFTAGLFYLRGSEKALQFFTGYLVELSLSIDNLFVFLLIFGYFEIPPQYRHKVLFWGIFGALIMRAVFIAVGVTVITKFHWIVYIFGMLLVVTGIKMTVQKNKAIDFQNNLVLRIVRRILPVFSGFENGKFFVRRGGQTMATPLFLVLILLESTDLIFAVDSVPAVLAITPDPFIVFTSNVFAILGLRSMFFALQGMMQRFQHLQYGLSAVLLLVGVKMLVSDIYKLPTWISLLCIVGILFVSIVSSMLCQVTEHAVSGLAGR
jgi:tellurite resistance protein TerC